MPIMPISLSNNYISLNDNLYTEIVIGYVKRHDIVWGIIGTSMYLRISNIWL